MQKKNLFFQKKMLAPVVFQTFDWIFQEEEGAALELTLYPVLLILALKDLGHDALCLGAVAADSILAPKIPCGEHSGPDPRLGQNQGVVDLRWNSEILGVDLETWLSPGKQLLRDMGQMDGRIE